MAEVFFYELTREPLDAVLPKILAGLYARGDDAVVYCKSEAVIEDISQKLWSFEDTSFIPHAVPGDKSSVGAPLRFVLGDSADPARYAFYVEGNLPDAEFAAHRASILFDSMNEGQLQQARDSWKVFKQAGHTIKYWKQNDTGRWEDQAAR